MSLCGQSDFAARLGPYCDYVEMQWLMLQQEHPEYFGSPPAARRVCVVIELKAQQLGRGRCNGMERALLKGRRGDTGTGSANRSSILSSGRVGTLLGDPSKAKEKLGWMPTTTLEELVAEMVAVDVEEAKKEAYLKSKGFAVVGHESELNQPNDRFAIFGARGMAGSAISRALDRAGYQKQLKPSRDQLDLPDLLR